MGRRKILSMLVILALFISALVNAVLYSPLIRMGDALGNNISYDLDNSTTLNITVKLPTPRINWYDFQEYYTSNSTWVSKLNKKIDIDNGTTNIKYRFVVNVTNDYGWGSTGGVGSHVWINITGWHDNGSDTTKYNDTSVPGDENTGGNRNFNLSYDSNLATAVQYKMHWPTNRTGMTKKGFTDVNKSNAGIKDPIGTSRTHNLTFEFVPGYQFRCADSDNTWTAGRINYTAAGVAGGVHSNPSYENGSYWWALNDPNSWNFNITVFNNLSTPTWDRVRHSTAAYDEFGVYSYTAILSAGWPKINGIPGENASASAVTITTRSNGNYALSVNLSDLKHIIHPQDYTIDNDTVFVKGGNNTGGKTFITHKAVYLYGSLAGGSSVYCGHEAHGNQKTTGTNNADLGYPADCQTTNSISLVYKCLIPPGTAAGTYRSTLHYILITEP